MSRGTYPIVARLGKRRTPYRGDAELVDWQGASHWRWPDGFLPAYAPALADWHLYAPIGDDPLAPPSSCWPRRFHRESDDAVLELDAEGRLTIRLREPSALDRGIVRAVKALHDPPWIGRPSALADRVKLYQGAICELDKNGRPSSPSDVAEAIRGEHGDERHVRRDARDWWRYTHPDEPDRIDGAWPWFRAEALGEGRK